MFGFYDKPLQKMAIYYSKTKIRFLNDTFMLF